jgi:hypothetical protein
MIADAVRRAVTFLDARPWCNILATTDDTVFSMFLLFGIKCILHLVGKIAEEKGVKKKGIYDYEGWIGL